MMDENDLMDSLEERAGGVAVGAAPIDRMTADATRTRRRTTLLGGLAAAAVVAIGAVVVVQVLPEGDGAGGGVPVAVEPGPVDVAPDGFTYVGSGTAAIAVPSEWPRNEITCSNVPTATTYVIDVYGGLTCTMMAAFPADADAIEVKPLAQVDTSGWTPTDLEGVDALTSPMSTETPDPALSGAEVTSRSIAIPSQDIAFTVSSSIDPANVDDLLAGVTILDEHVGVPGFFDLQPVTPQDDSQLDAYVARLEAAGLEVEQVEQTDRRYYDPGTVISVSPEPGTVVDAGSTVEVTVSASDAKGGR